MFNSQFQCFFAGWQTSLMFCFLLEGNHTVAGAAGLGLLLAIVLDRLSEPQKQPSYPSTKAIERGRMSELHKRRDKRF